MLKTEVKVTYTSSDNEKQKVGTVKGEKILYVWLQYFFETQQKKFNVFPQEEKKNLVCLQFQEAFSWLHFDLLLVQMHCYTSSASWLLHF